MKPYHKLLLLFLPLLLVANSCEPDDPPDPEETIWNTPHQIERELFDFPLGSYWVMQNTLDTTQIDTFTRIRYSMDTTYRQVGNDLVIDVVLQVGDTVVGKSVSVGISYRKSISPYLYVDNADDEFYLRTDFDYSNAGALIPDVRGRGWTQIEYPSPDVVRFEDIFLGGYIDIERNKGLFKLYGANTLWTRIDYHHAN